MRMGVRRSPGGRVCLWLAAALAAALAPGPAGAQILSMAEWPNRLERIEVGQRLQIDGADLVSWAKVDRSGAPLQIGVTVARDILVHPPAEKGSGPAGAMAVLAFPPAVRTSSFPDHFELHWLVDGHPSDPHPAPHFVLGFYRVPPAEVLRMSGRDRTPAEARLPAGYLYPGEEHAVPQMGVRAVSAADLGRAVRYSLSLGYFGGKLISLGPMVTREYLQRRLDFSFRIPVPPELGGRLFYPTRFVAHYDPLLDAYQLILADFVRTRA